MSDKEEAGSSSGLNKENTNSEERKSHTSENGEGGGGSTGPENSQSISAECGSAENSCGTAANIEQIICESSAESVPVASQPLHNERFARRNHSTRRQYRRRSGEPESSGDEQVPVSTFPSNLHSELVYFSTLLAVLVQGGRSVCLLSCWVSQVFLNCSLRTPRA